MSNKTKDIAKDVKKAVEISKKVNDHVGKTE